MGLLSTQPQFQILNLSQNKYLAAGVIDGRNVWRSGL
ncbi:5-methyltetrahydropteroyltriglutamate-- homocysteine methyltransferase, partial [Listeria innocua FSL S4-378]